VFALLCKSIDPNYLPYFALIAIAVAYFRLITFRFFCSIYMI
jgi:hypothetical protein